MKDYNELWSLVVENELTLEEVDQFSIEEVKILGDLFICYFAQMGNCVNLSFPFSINYINIKKKVDKVKL